jgi:phosphoribosylglycinamide formyltransferase-1
MFSSSSAAGKKVRLAIFASGNGSNAQRIIDHFRDHAQIEVALVVCNKPGAGVIDRAAAAGIPVLQIERERFLKGDAYLPGLREAGIGFIVLAGFLWKLPPVLIAAFPQRIVNIHPALLPAYGGKGMWGHHVHAAVLEAGEAESGITIHYVDEHYDHGAHLLQVRCPVLAGDTPESLAARVHDLEHQWFPKVIEETVLESLRAGSAGQ